jgi:hypothetical protein
MYLNSLRVISVGTINEQTIEVEKPITAFIFPSTGLIPSFI